MHKRHGFTAVELAIVIVIMGILLTVGIISFRGMQATSRDKEREADVQAIATLLESIYPQEIKTVPGIGGAIVKKAGSYPSRAVFDFETGTPRKYYNLVFENLTRGADCAPDANCNPPSSLITSTNLTPTPTVSQYIYVPSQPGGIGCGDVDEECRRFKIYYKLESGEVKVLESKRR